MSDVDPRNPSHQYPLARTVEPVADAPDVVALHTEAEEEMLDQLYVELKPMAVDAYINYFLARTPAHLQADMIDLLKGDLAEPPIPPALDALKADYEGRDPRNPQQPRRAPREMFAPPDMRRNVAPLPGEPQRDDMTEAQRRKDDEMRRTEEQRLQDGQLR